MSFDAPSVPFTTDAYEGFATTEGLLSVIEENLIIEFKTKDSFFGLIQSDVKRLEIPLSDLKEFEFQKKLFGSKIIVRLDSLQALDGIPGSKQGIAKLSIRKQDRDAASALATHISLQLSENKLKRLDEEMKRLEE